jgi:hypothetical protein
MELEEGVLWPLHTIIRCLRLSRWIKKVGKSAVSCFDRFISTLGKYKPYIVNYFKMRKNGGFVERMNNKIKVAIRRCYGFSAVKTIFQRLFLDFCFIWGNHSLASLRGQADSGFALVLF